MVSKDVKFYKMIEFKVDEFKQGGKWMSFEGGKNNLGQMIESILMERGTLEVSQELAVRAQYVGENWNFFPFLSHWIIHGLVQA